MQIISEQCKQIWDPSIITPQYRFTSHIPRQKRARVYLCRSYTACRVSSDHVRPSRGWLIGAHNARFNAFVVASLGDFCAGLFFLPSPSTIGGRRRINATEEHAAVPSERGSNGGSIDAALIWCGNCPHSRPFSLLLPEKANELRGGSILLAIGMFAGVVLIWSYPILLCSNLYFTGWNLCGVTILHMGVLFFEA